MKKQAGLLLMALVLSFQAHSADFKPAKKLKNSNLEALSNDISEIISDKKLEAVIAVNDIINEVSSFSFTRKPTEIDLNTVKQFNIKFLDIYPESDGMGVPATEITTTNATDVVNAVFGVYYFGDFSDEDQVVLKKAYNAILASVIKHTKKMTDSSLKFFDAVHSDEDGSWGTLTILDTKNNEILAVKFGASGT